MQRQDCSAPCIDKLRKDIIEIVGQIGLTDPQQKANFQFANLDIMLNDMLQEAFTGNTRARDVFQAEMARLNAARMFQAEQESQYIERARLIDKIAEKFQNPSLTLTQLRATITNLDELILNDRWDEVIAEFERQGYTSGLGQEWESFKNHMKQRAAATKQMAVSAYSYVSNHAYPMLCWLMAFLCMIPEPCFSCLKGALIQVGLGYLFDMMASPSACAYWKAKVAGFMYQGYQDLTQQQIDQATESAIWALFGITTTTADMCTKSCILLSNTFNNILHLGENNFFNGLSYVSELLDLANVARINDASSVASSVISYKSILGIDPKTQREIFEMFNPDLVQEVNERVESGSFFTGKEEENSQVMGSKFSDDSSSDDGMQRPEQARFTQYYSESQTGDMTPGSSRVSLQDPLSGVLLSTKKITPYQRKQMIDKKVREVKTGAKTTEDLLKENKQKMYNKTGSKLRKSNSLGGRKSRRYKKKRSTLKRHGLKRRRTRKGKKRRHTKKRR